LIKPQKAQNSQKLKTACNKINRLKTRKIRLLTFYDTIKIDGLVKSLQGRHSRESGSPELVDFTGFPLSRE
jgi:hypothetical protein